MENINYLVCYIIVALLLIVFAVSFTFICIYFVRRRRKETVDNLRDVVQNTYCFDSLPRLKQGNIAIIPELFNTTDPIQLLNQIEQGDKNIRFILVDAKENVEIEFFKKYGYTVKEIDCNDYKCN